MDHELKASIGELEEILGRFAATRRVVLEGALSALVECARSGGKVLVFGNGGSAAEAQHFAAELVNGFLDRRRPPFAALALTTDTSTLTAIANDRAFLDVFSRQIEALGRPGDAVIALTTSGVSRNVIKGLKTARSRRLTTIVLTGQATGAVAPLADFLLDVPSCSTPRVQEAHLVLLHFLAEALEKELVLR